jgi:hypothetical protein
MAVSIVTKNTFVEIEEQEVAPLRRSTSLPPCVKLATSADCLQPSREDYKLDVDSSAVDDGLSSQGSTRGSWDVEVCSACTQATNISEFSTPHSEAMWSSSQSTPAQQSAPTPMCFLAPARFAQMRQQVPGPMEAFQAAAMAAFTALTAAGQPELHRSRFGWQVVVKLGADQMHLKDCLLSSSKAAIVSASEQSSGTYIVGYQVSPFMDSPLGFSALLAYVDRPSEVCWDLLQWGVCRYEGNCRWRHSEQQATLNVMVVPANG